MVTDETTQDAPESRQAPTEPAAMSTANRKRPKLDLSAATNPRERKRGKSMFGILLGTLNKAKIEDKERNASEAAKKRQLIEQRLQNKLRKETDSVRRAEEAKKDKTAANRKEEDLQLKDSIYKLRRTRLPLLANFLLTSDIITTDDDSLDTTPPPPPPATNPLSLPPRTHPPPLYYLPAILTPAQEAFIARRKSQVDEAAEKEWESFREERTAGIAEIKQLRQRVAEEEDRKRAERSAAGGDANVKDEMDIDEPHPANNSEVDGNAATIKEDEDTNTKVAADQEKKEREREKEKEKEESVAPAPPVAEGDDDAVEY